MVALIDLKEKTRVADALRRDREPLRPASIDEAVDGRILFANLERGLTIRVPFTEGMEAGGRYHVILQSVDGDGAFGMGGTILEENQDATVKVSPDRALAFRGQQANLYYFYLGYPVEESTSPITKLSMEAQIYKPVVDEAVDGVIPLSAQSRGVNLRIRASSSITLDALVSIYWVGSNGEACFVKHFNIEAADVGKDINVAVDPDYLVPIKYGNANVIYTVQSIAGTWTSPPLGLSVAGYLSSPEAVYTYGAGYCVAPELLPIDESGKIPMKLNTQGMAEGDVATLIFIGGYLGSEFVLSHTVTGQDIGVGHLLFAVPALFASLGFGVTVMSMVERLAGGAIGSPVLRLSLNQSGQDRR